MQHAWSNQGRFRVTHLTHTDFTPRPLHMTLYTTVGMEQSMLVTCQQLVDGQSGYVGVSERKQYKSTKQAIKGQSCLLLDVGLHW